MRERFWVLIEGVVQGVGFRPFVHGLAMAHALDGFVRNDARGVVIDIEGEGARLRAFVDDVRRAPPPLAHIERIRVEHGRVVGHSGFRIAESDASQERAAFVAADAATCEACIAELFDPADRRYRYPFLNCTNCGPRLTIITDMPYDRSRTTMAAFPMCGTCRAEYENPADRRFHAQPVACPACGPRLVLQERSAAKLVVADPLASAVEALAAGRIVAVKGMGGYHLACDALDADAVTLLRRRKRRAEKPFAVMVRDLAAARALCTVSTEEEALLASPQRPIVLLRKRAACALEHDPESGNGSTRVAEAVAPGNRDLGVMLPYTPLHHLLAAEAGRPLVMTSGNRSEEPIAYDDEDARTRLADIADIFLVHDRPIAMRCDDSVARTLGRRETLLRRARGFAPQPIPLPLAADVPVLAMGGDLKNTFALSRGGNAFVSHHIGDLEDLATYRELRRTIAHYAHLLGIRPEIVAHDLHPGYLSARLAAEFDAISIGVQHHHAHAAACMAEHGIDEPTLAVVFDGTGYGTDGTIWGGEFLIARYDGFDRVGHLGYVRLPGGDAAVREPWRSAAAHVLAACGTNSDAATMLAARVGDKRWRTIARMLETNAFSVPTSSVGRLFDAVAALLGLRHEVAFEAQAAIALEALADPVETGCYPVELTPTGTALVWHPEPVIEGIAADLRLRRPHPEIAGRFHNTVCAAIMEMARRVRRAHGLSRVALTGGVFQNLLLTERTATALGGEGFNVLVHRRVPTNDGGLSLGQAAIACAQAAGMPGR